MVMAAESALLWLLVCVPVPPAPRWARFDFFITRKPGFAKLLRTASINFVDKLDGRMIPNCCSFVCSELEEARFSTPSGFGLKLERALIVPEVTGVTGVTTYGDRGELRLFGDPDDNGEPNGE